MRSGNRGPIITLVPNAEIHSNKWSDTYAVFDRFIARFVVIWADWVTCGGRIEKIYRKKGNVYGSIRTA